MNLNGRIIAYLSGELDEIQKREFLDSLEQDPQLRQEYLKIKKICDVTRIQQISIPDGRKKELYTRILASVGKTNNRFFTSAGLKILRYAAFFLLLAGLPVMYYIGKGNIGKTNTFPAVTCAAGDKSALVLPDSSLVVMNSGSTLRFHPNFINGHREVFLEGEAYFKVAKDPGNPFVVRTTDLDVEVLGTEFNLKAYPEEDNYSATLIEGSLKVSAGEQKIILKPRQKLVYYKDEKNMFLKRLLQTSPETEWKDGRLVFRNESLADLELKLERWFDVDISFADDVVKQRRFTGILERESILETISYFSHSRYVGYIIEKNQITFYSKNM